MFFRNRLAVVLLFLSSWSIAAEPVALQDTQVPPVRLEARG